MDLVDYLSETESADIEEITHRVSSDPPAKRYDHAVPIPMNEKCIAEPNKGDESYQYYPSITK